jgi:polyphosphate glucokinase
MEAFGVDIGGTGIKGAPVDVDTGELTAERIRLETPHPSKPDAVAATVADVVRHFGWIGPIGCTFPAVVKNGVTLSAANVDHAWIGTDAAAVLAAAIGSRVTVHNDAAMAGVAEMRFGAGKDRDGVVVIVTLGTGIGTALFHDGARVPTTEFGHIEIHGEDAESTASDRARVEQNLSWKRWAKRVEVYLRHLENLLWPDLFIIGGGVSKRADKWLPMVETRTEVVPARLLNEAGIVGAAITAADG